MGFTLLELLISLLLVSILVILSFASLQQFFAAGRLRYNSEHLQSLITEARLQALAQGEIISLCSSHDAEHCDLLKAKEVWDGALLIRSAQHVLKVYSAVTFPFCLYWVNALVPKSTVNFNANDFRETEQGTFYLCSSLASHKGVALIVLQSGRLRITNDYSKLAGICG